MRRAFTLIELLVVVSIIALLIAILLPVLGQASYSSKLTRCGSNLQQVGVGVFAYAGDHDQYYPRRRVAFDSIQPRKRIVAEYIGTANAMDDRAVLADYFTIDLLQCPFSRFDSATAIADSSAQVIHGSYELYFGSPIVRDEVKTHLTNIETRAWADDLKTGEEFELNVLAADTDWDYTLINTWITSHPDRGEGRLRPTKTDDPTRTSANWKSTTGDRGPIDRNLLYRDGSVLRLGNHAMDDPSMARVPAINSRPGDAVYHYLPKD